MIVDSSGSENKQKVMKQLEGGLNALNIQSPIKLSSKQVHFKIDEADKPEYMNVSNFKKEQPCQQDEKQSSGQKNTKLKKLLHKKKLDKFASKQKSEKIQSNIKMRRSISVGNKLQKFDSIDEKFNHQNPVNRFELPTPEQQNFQFFQQNVYPVNQWQQPVNPVPAFTSYYGPIPVQPQQSAPQFSQPFFQQASQFDFSQYQNNPQVQVVPQIHHNNVQNITQNIYITMENKLQQPQQQPVPVEEDDFIIKTEEKPRKMGRHSSMKHNRNKRMNKTSNFMNMTMAQMVKDKEVNPLVLKKKLSDKQFKTPNPKQPISMSYNPQPDQAVMVNHFDDIDKIKQIQPDEGGYQFQQFSQETPTTSGSAQK